ncbi:Uncharacterised protein [Chromobacterium vaccinii]|nr:Uncharacterised protein [Chromobacterium vaccinii]
MGAIGDANPLFLQASRRAGQQGKAAIAQKSGFLRRGGTAGYPVAVGKAAEAADDVAVAFRMAQPGLIQAPRFDVAAHLERGELVKVMPAHLVYPSRRHLSRRVQAFLIWLEALLAPHARAER